MILQVEPKPINFKVNFKLLPTQFLRTSTDFLNYCGKFLIFYKILSFRNIMHKICALFVYLPSISLCFSHHSIAFLRTLPVISLKSARSIFGRFLNFRMISIFRAASQPTSKISLSMVLNLKNFIISCTKLIIIRCLMYPLYLFTESCSKIMISLIINFQRWSPTIYFFSAI